ncbi:MAG: hypothetical protein FD180_2687 [Planctomycetota bacterium]|nr:MAG: hypothetical protein FD180_2687 [Planctomycetota bacterium]
MRFTMTTLLAALFFAGAASAQELDCNQKQALDRQAYVNVNHISKATTYGVGTKGDEDVVREMLVENVK